MFWKKKKGPEQEDRSITGSLKSLLQSIRKATAGENIFLEPIDLGSLVIIPIVSCKVALGKREGDAGQGLGGGASATPMAFMIVDQSGTRVIGFDSIEVELAQLLDGEALSGIMDKLGKSGRAGTKRESQ